MPIVPPAPGRFSISTGCPNADESLSATGRAIVSVAEPGVNGTMMRIGLDGKACASAAVVRVASSAASSAFMGSLLWQYDAMPVIHGIDVEHRGSGRDLV